MGGRVSLALVIHNHQPVGNFGWVIADVYEHAYSPMLGALERHPGIRLGLHYTGPLLQWMAANRPEAIAQIRRLVDRGQVEIVGGGLLRADPGDAAGPRPQRPAGPDARRAGDASSGGGPRGRGWRSGSGSRRSPTTWPRPATSGPCSTTTTSAPPRSARTRCGPPLTTDDRGRRLTVFGTEQGLRYRIPFKPVEDVISYLRERTTPDGRFVGMMGDDGEKFGAWPGTFEYCWSREHWVDRLFEA